MDLENASDAQLNMLYEIAKKVHQQIGWALKNEENRFNNSNHAAFLFIHRGKNNNEDGFQALGFDSGCNSSNECSYPTFKPEEKRKSRWFGKSKKGE